MIFEMKFWKELFNRFNEDDVPGMAAQLSYFFLLSLLPFMIFLLTLLAFLPVSQDQVFDILSRYLPPDAYSLINENLSGVMENQNSGLLSVGIIGTIWSASNGIKALMKAFNRAYHIEEDRPFLKQRLVSIALTIAMILMVAIALALPVFGRLIGEFLFSYLGLSEGFLTLWESMRWAISIILMMTILTILFILAPNKKIPIAYSLPGAIIATIGWALTSLGFSYYVTNFANYSATYGSLGAVIVLMIWFFLTGVMIILGGEVNAILDRHDRTLLSKK
ncbi:ribonuclease [Halalkalibacillus sediminis]|uniref:Ribonuclease n=1 Tax=Halalkalibacillus sediminis TaxID=2018042 RepID=A0A2I0QS57_9BACI|nr:YihY/virulence factor BrkB family protein [Halalkalibacillus sediminis]PKR76930.1 ribonuclease [Halalkalibacillus sediminis]